MKRAKVILVQQDNLECLPPLLSVISILQKRYDVLVLTGRRNPKVIENMWDAERVSFKYLWQTQSHSHKNAFLRKFYSLRKLFQEACWMRGEISRQINQDKIAFIWVGSVETAFYFSRFFRKKTYVANAYELLDEFPLYRWYLRHFYQNAKRVVVPEKNRAYIFKFWMSLDVLPLVVPNKPQLNLKRKVPSSSKPSKSILYQGVFNPRERCLDAFCEAVEELPPEYELLLIGRENDYSKKLCSKYKKVRYGGYHPAPSHLEITKNAYIGIATYAPKTLNSTYCAPNKIWEYGACSLPMLINDSLGLKGYLSPWNCAVVIDERDKNSIRDGILSIAKNYSSFSRQARSFYDSENIEEKIESIGEGECPLCLTKNNGVFWTLIGVVARGVLGHLHSHIL